jgi:hypothetical protein
MYLQGGLGNQLFQLAAGLATANRLQVRLILDCSRLGDPNTALRKYALHPFALPDQIDVVHGSSRWNAFFHKRAVNRVKNLLSHTHYLENAGAFDPAFEDVKAGFTLDGYFQSIGYFESVKPQMIELIADCKLSQAESDVVEEYSQEPFTAIHVRRGDYTNPQVAAVHGIAGQNYFRNALSELDLASNTGRKLYFSDSPDFVREEFGLEIRDFAPNNLSEAATLLLMSRANNVIASNSTFSWWAGLAAESSKNGIVIVPKPWFADTTPPHLVPPHWRQIPKN